LEHANLILQYLVCSRLDLPLILFEDHATIVAA
jgi:hypothetical protein